jgi:Phage major capsid protein E
MLTLDIFKQDAFSDISLTAAILKMPFRPTLLGDLKLFSEKGVATTSIFVEEKQGQLSLISDTPRGAPAVNPLTRSLRTARSFRARHLVREAPVMADEIQNVRQFGQVDSAASQLETVMSVVEERMEYLRAMQDFTLEYHRLGAVKGLILDADGTTTLLDLFAEFGVSQQTQDFAFTNALTDVRSLAVNIRRMIQTELGGASYTELRAICSPSFFDALIAHPLVKLSYQYQEGIVLREDLGMTGFLFGGITWQEYRGQLIPEAYGASDLIAAGTAYVFPMGAMTVDGPLFRVFFAPADFIEAANTIGLPLYVKLSQDPDGLNRFMKIHTQSNPLAICLRPRAVVKCTSS